MESSDKLAPDTAEKPNETSAEVTPENTPSSPAEPVLDAPEEMPVVSSAKVPSIAPTAVVVGQPHRLRWKVWAIILVVLLLAAGGFWVWHSRGNSQPAATPTRAAKASTTPKPKVAGLQLDTTKNYGDKYASGVLPVGDGKYVTAAAKTGYIYTCSGYAQNIKTQAGGAGKPGPWFSADGKTYDVNKKSHVVGSVMWKADFTNTVSGSTRTITTNDLPSHPTGIFPIQATDPAYAYDKNPNSIQGQSLTMSLAASPAYSQTPTCESGTVGVMLTGIMLYSGFDAGGRDAGAWEVQDNCDGHPQSEGQYHYHTLSRCITDTSVKTVIGYALDGFPITGPKLGVNGTLTTSDLDECHGIVSAYTLDGKTVTGYHYVMTQDFPYSVSCFRGTPISPPGQPGKQPA